MFSRSTELAVGAGGMAPIFSLVNRFCFGGGRVVLGKLPVPRRPTNLDCSRARACCTCSRNGWGCLDIFLSSIISSLSPSLWETARYRLKHCLKGPLKPKQSTNQLSQSSAKRPTKRNLMTFFICSVVFLVLLITTTIF